MLPIYILNIRSNQKRRYLCEGALFAKETPFERIKHWWAIDDGNYMRTRELCDKAIEDGFPQFQEYLDKGQHNEYGIGMFAQTWNYCRFWRHLIENDEIAVLTQDDRLLGCTYPRLMELYAEIQAFDPEFRFMSLWCKESVVEKSFPGRLPFRYIYEGASIAEGIYENGTCAGHIITPVGAKKMIEMVAGIFPPRVEFAVNTHIRKKGYPPHFYTLVNEEENMKHLVKIEGYVGSQIFDHSPNAPDGFLRPIYTTMDMD